VHRNVKALLAVVALLGGAAVSAAQTAKPTKAKPAKKVEPPPIDRAALTEQVRAAEIAFAKTVADDRIDLFEGFLDPETVFVSGMTTTRGKAAVVESWRGSFGPGRPDFTWHPEVIELSPDATFALSRGPWVIRTVDKRGRVKETKGVFNSIWRRHPDGSWKVLYDAGCPPCADCR
jgi:ketosteroid isomerase-like protein